MHVAKIKPASFKTFKKLQSHPEKRIQNISQNLPASNLKMQKEKKKPSLCIHIIYKYTFQILIKSNILYTLCRTPSNTICMKYNDKSVVYIIKHK